ncbi:MAG TPA: prolipoprotein diacylglyceryl transferase [Capsulimonadaceae bacterium]|jgi:phosphatidylglycerol:prolipoprotein diacylglycerol transferase
MHPDLFAIPILGNRVIHTYGVLLLVGFVLSLWRAVIVARRKGESPVSAQDVLDVSVWMLLSGIFFARLTFVLLDLKLHPYTLLEVFAIWNGGITFDGALFGGLLAITIFSTLRKLPLLSLLDLLSPPSVIGYAIGRVGCFFNGCCYGAPTALPWGVNFPMPGSVSGHTLPSHPVQLYSTITSFILFGLLSMRQKRSDLRSGDIFSWYLIGSGIERFIMEYFRSGVTSDLVRNTPFTLAQFFCFFLIGCGIIGLSIIYRKSGSQSKAAAAPESA